MAIAAGGARHRQRGRRRRQRGRHAGTPSTAFPRPSAPSWDAADAWRCGASAVVALLLLASAGAMRALGPHSTSAMLLTWMFVQAAVLAVWHAMLAPLLAASGANRTLVPLRRAAAAVWLADAALAITAILG